MVKMVLEVEGMVCGMCEAHVNGAIRKAFPVRKVTSSHAKGRTEILAEQPLNEEKLKEAVSTAGYTVKTVRTEPYETKGLYLFGK